MLKDMINMDLLEQSIYKFVSDFIFRVNFYFFKSRFFVFVFNFIFKKLILKYDNSLIV